jgi:predicted DNA-binding transcriptional regulator AlpA
MSVNDRFIKIDEVIQCVGIGKTKILELSKSGKFVKPLKIDGFSSKLFSFLEIQNWMEEQKKKRDQTE